MKNEDITMLENKIRNLTFIVILGFVIVGMLVLGQYFIGNSKTTSTSTSSNTTTTDSNYDVSKMTEVTGSEAAKLFDKEGTQFLYIGRPTCGVCVSLVPNLNQVISDLGVTIHYSELKDSFRTDFEPLFDHLSVETKVNASSGEVSGTYGELLKQYGFTPVVIVIKDGKMVDGFIGNRDADTIKTLFQKYL